MSEKNIITFRNTITDDEIIDIISEIKKVSGITFFSLNNIKKFSILSIYSSNKLVGVIFFKEHRKHIDFKVAIIKEKFRNQGYMKLLQQKFLGSKSKKIYCASKNNIMINILRKNNFKEIKFIQLPIAQQIRQLLLIFSIKRIREYIRKRRINKDTFKFYERK